MKRLIYITAIVVMLAIMMIPPITDSYVGSTEIKSSENFNWGNYYSNWYLYVQVTAWEEPSRKVELRVFVKAPDIIRFFPAVELYSAPKPVEGEFNKDILGKYYFKEEIGHPYGAWYILELSEDEDSPAVFGRASCGVAAGTGPEAIVVDIVFTNGIAPDIHENDEDWEDLSSMLRSQICISVQEDDPFGFYCGSDL